MLAAVWICPECRSVYEKRQDVCSRCNIPLAEVRSNQSKARYPLLGKVVDHRYRLIGGLGQGGLGTVYLAQHLHLMQLFAVKFLDLETVGVEATSSQKHEYARDFLNEARVASLIRHDAVVRVTDFGDYNKMPYLVMEYVPGPSLFQVLETQRQLPVSEALNIARRIAEALDAFHKQQLVHRDLKPANVILDPRGGGRLTLVDLGLVKDLSSPTAKNSTHPMALRGTPGYLAPEQVPAWVLASVGISSLGEKRPVDTLVDIYALGVILYECIAGASPYPPGSNTAIIINACTRDPTPLSSVAPQVQLKPGLAELIYDTMARDPERRPQSAEAFIKRLDLIAQSDASNQSWPSLHVPGRPSTAENRGLFPPIEGDEASNYQPPPQLLAAVQEVEEPAALKVHLPLPIDPFKTQVIEEEDEEPGFDSEDEDRTTVSEVKADTEVCEPVVLKEKKSASSQTCAPHTALPSLSQTVALVSNPQAKRIQPDAPEQPSALRRSVILWVVLFAILLGISVGFVLQMNEAPPDPMPQTAPVLLPAQPPSPQGVPSKAAPNGKKAIGNGELDSQRMPGVQISIVNPQETTESPQRRDAGQ